MREIYLLRHAKSSWAEPTIDDFDRPLAKRGLKAGKKVARYLAEAGIRPDAVLCSAARRTRQTLELVQEACKPGATVLIERGLYLAGARKLLNRIRKLPDSAGSVLVIGHNPGMQELAMLLTGSGQLDMVQAMLAKFPTAGLAVFRSGAEHWADVQIESGELVSYVYPKALPD